MKTKITFLPPGVAQESTLQSFNFYFPVCQDRAYRSDEDGNQKNLSGLLPSRKQKRKEEVPWK